MDIWDRIKWVDSEQRRGVIHGGVYDGLHVGLIHCDPLVLHSPGVCCFCDEHGTDLQTERKELKIAFTDDELYSNLQCPAHAQRGKNCQVWGGNRPAGTREEYEAAQVEYWREVRRLSGVED